MRLLIVDFRLLIGLQIESAISNQSEISNLKSAIS